MNRRPQLQALAPDASPEEAAALAAALERFMREHAQVLVEIPAPSSSPWLRAALAEGVRRAPQALGHWE